MEAQLIYERMLKTAPDNVYVLTNLSTTQLRLGDLKLAEATIKKAIAINPQDDRSHCTLGIIYYQQRKFDAAAQSLAHALLINAQNSAARDYLILAANQIALANEKPVVRREVLSAPLRREDVVKPLEAKRFELQARPTGPSLFLAAPSIRKRFAAGFRHAVEAGRRFKVLTLTVALLRDSTA